MTGKRALVCGASQGIGKATAIELSKMGYSVTLLSRSQEKLEAVQEELSFGDHDILSCDIGDPDTWVSELEKRQKESPYSAVILNSGGPKGGVISQAQPEDFIQAMQNHLVANSLIVRTVMGDMKAKSFGRIVAITSTSVKIPIPHLGVSNTARAAVASWAKTISLELAPFGITVNNVMPGFTETPRLQSLIEAAAKDVGKVTKDIEDSWKMTIPMRRFAKPEETAALIGFLCSDKASYITGQNIAVDGGRLGCL